MPAGDLCTLADVRLGLETPTADTSRDNLISALIPVASQMICQQAEREFAPSSAPGVVRRVKVSGRELDSGIVDLNPYDLQSATVVSLNPESASPTILAAGVDYELSPVVQPADEPVYTSLRLSYFLNVVPSNLVRFGYAYLDVTGTWGFPAVPASVARGCVEAVMAWLRKDVSQLGLNLQDGAQIDPTSVVSLDLPLSTIRKINPYRRHGGVF